MRHIVSTLIQLATTEKPQALVSLHLVTLASHTQLRDIKDKKCCITDFIDYVSTVQNDSVLSQHTGSTELCLGHQVSDESGDG